MPWEDRLKRITDFTDSRMRLHVSHLTKYEYDKPVHYALQQVRLTPKSEASQNVLTWNLSVEGGRKELEFSDQHQNLVTLISLHEEQSEISIHATGEVETTAQGGITGHQYGDTPLWYFKRSTPLTKPGEQIQTLGKSLADDTGDPCGPSSGRAAGPAVSGRRISRASAGRAARHRRRRPSRLKPEAVKLKLPASTPGTEW